MRYLILSDIHANLEALNAVLGDAPADAYEHVVILGDLVGYGGDPNAVIDRVRALSPHVLIRGNHDKVAAGIEEPEGFNTAARQAAQWTFKALTPENRTYLAALPAGPHALDALVEVCHGAPHDEDAYIFEELEALTAFDAMQRPVCIYGHTHVPVVYSLAADVLEIQTPDPEVETVLSLDPARRYLINPGSVGQPRDGNPRAAYGLLDTDRTTMRLRRVPYAVASAQHKIRRVGLPDPLAQRLEIGR